MALVHYQNSKNRFAVSVHWTLRSYTPHSHAPRSCPSLGVFSLPYIHDALLDHGMQSGPGGVGRKRSGLHDLIAEAGAVIVGVVVFLFAGHHAVKPGGHRLIEGSFESAFETGIGWVAIEGIGGIDQMREAARGEV